MTRPASPVQVRESLSPLLQSIQSEINERMQSLRAAQERLADFRPTRAVHGAECARLESEISLQRRELRRIQSELARLGVPFDAEDPRPILAAVAALGYPRSLDESGFRPRFADSRA